MVGHKTMVALQNGQLVEYDMATRSPIGLLGNVVRGARRIMHAARCLLCAYMATRLPTGSAQCTHVGCIMIHEHGVLCMLCGAWWSLTWLHVHSRACLAMSSAAHGGNVNRRLHVHAAWCTV